MEILEILLILEILDSDSSLVIRGGYGRLREDGIPRF